MIKLKPEHSPLRSLQHEGVNTLLRCTPSLKGRSIHRDNWVPPLSLWSLLTGQSPSLPGLWASCAPWLGSLILPPQPHLEMGIHQGLPSPACLLAASWRLVSPHLCCIPPGNTYHRYHFLVLTSYNLHAIKCKILDFSAVSADMVCTCAKIQTLLLFPKGPLIPLSSQFLLFLRDNHF